MSQHEEPTDQQKPMKGHSYDGIEEFDYSLPRWWLNGFYLTILFSAIYFAYYVLGEGISIQTEYDRALRAHEVTLLEKKGSQPALSEDTLRGFLKDPARIQVGHEVFQTKCTSCHGAQGQGGIGPNLTDDYWIHGGKMTDILKVIANGVNDKGMPPWGTILKQEELYSVVAYVKSLRGSNPPNAKGPQGELVKE